MTIEMIKVELVISLILMFSLTGFEMDFNVSKDVNKIMEAKCVKEDKQCHQCSKVFSSKSAKTAHVKGIHENPKRYACETCDKLFSFKSNLVHHMASVHKKRKKLFQCQTCNKTFLQEGGLKQHIKFVHENIRDFECDQCKKYFHRLMDLRKHVSSA